MRTCWSWTATPLADLRIMADPRRNLKVIMKDGVIYENELG